MDKLPIGKANRVDAQVRAYARRNKVTVDQAVQQMVAKNLLSYEPETFTWTYKTISGKVVTCQHDEKYLNPQEEDKIVQKGMAPILNAIYENDFLDCSFGFRPNRNCHDALKILNVYIEKRDTNYIVDVDIKGFIVTGKQIGRAHV